ncbi:hypothetical protein GCM10007863_18310 [Dyella mobilis]|nr:hypothetical protein GCM10007863_18310 [Dyella mobilis]
MFILASLLASNAACSTDISGQWTLSVENTEHHVVATLRVEFTNENAASCMGGEWKVLRVISATAKEKDFFPTADPLSYQVDDRKLTIGRNEVCDAYLWLQGALGGASVRGDYFSLGPGGTTPLGYFNLSQGK